MAELTRQGEWISLTDDRRWKKHQSVQAGGNLLKVTPRSDAFRANYDRILWDTDRVDRDPDDFHPVWNETA